MLSLTSGKSSLSKERKTGSKCSIVADLPRTGATSITTDARADLTCCEESAAKSLTHGIIHAMTRSAGSILQIAETLLAAATLTSASVSRSNLTYAGTSSFLQVGQHAKSQHNMPPKQYGLCKIDRSKAHIVGMKPETRVKTENELHVLSTDSNQPKEQACNNKSCISMFGQRFVQVDKVHLASSGPRASQS